MGGKSGVSLPKVKVSAPAVVSKAISSVTKPLETVAKGAIKSTGDIAGSALKGDIKGVAGGALGAVQSLKDAGKQFATGQLGLGAGALGALGGLTGSKEISETAGNIEREGGKGVNQYGDVAMDVGANLATGGAYGGVKTGVEALSDSGLKGLLSGKMLSQAALSAADSSGMLAPGQVEAIKGGASAAQAASKGDIKNLALQGLGSYGGLKPDQVAMAKTGIAAATGDKEGLVSGLASQAGAKQDTAELAGAVASGNKKQIASRLASKAGAGKTASNIAGSLASGKSVENIAKQELMKKGRAVASDAAGAKAKDLGLDKMNKDLISKFKKSGVADLSGKIGKGVVASKQLTSKQLNDLRSVQDLSGKIAPGVVESGKTAQSLFDASKGNQFDPNQAFQDWSKSQTGYVGKDKKAAMQKLFQDRAAGNVSADDFAVSQSNIEQGKLPAPTSSATPQPEGPGFFDKAKQFVSGNKGALGLGADVIAAGAGYMAGEAGRQEAKGLSEQQLKELKGAGAAFEKMQYDPTRYKQEREFLQQRIAGGGLTPQEKLLQQQGDVRAARAGAAARLSGVEQQARMGRGVTGAGSALAASLAGGQSVMGTQAETNLAREASASQRLEQDIQRQTNLARQQTAEEADLAHQQGTFGLSRAQQTGAVRGDLGNLALGRAAALQNLAGQGAEMVKTGLSQVSSQEPAQAVEQAPIQPQQQQPQQPQQAPSQARTNAARNMSMGPAAPKPGQPQQATGKPGEGFGVLQSSQAPDMLKKAKDIFNQANVSAPAQVKPMIQQGQQALQQGQNVMQQGQKVAGQVQQGIKTGKDLLQKAKQGKVF